MLIKLSRSTDIKPSEITSESIYKSRRLFMQAGGVLGMGVAFPSLLNAAATDSADGFKTSETLTPLEDITSYNNFYELGLGKGDPKKNASKLITEPWSVEVAGECEKPGKLTLEDFLKPQDVEERVYRLRCVEGWSMVIPWQGFELGKALKQFQPTSKAKYVAFETLYDPENLPGQRARVLDWPYVEGLRMDEAMHPLTILATGLYGEHLPNQSGAPLRLVVPWKYGFKSIKSIVKITFTETEPPTSWNVAAPQEYGFYSNVNPEVRHPRWSQRRERRIGEFRKRETLAFNGYADQVAELYTDMDLKKYF